MMISIGVQPAKAIPAPPSAMRPIMRGGITRHYVAKWESVIRALAEFQPDWAKGFEVEDRALNQERAGQEINRRNFACLGDDQLLPGVEDHLLRDWTYKSFNRDALIAEEIKSIISITARFWPLVERSDLGEVTLGSHALECFVANLEMVSWENVIEFRNHAGAQEAREKLRDFEQRAVDAEPGSLEELRLKLLWRAVCQGLSTGCPRRGGHRRRLEGRQGLTGARRAVRLLCADLVAAGPVFVVRARLSKIERGPVGAAHA